MAEYIWTLSQAAARKYMFIKLVNTGTGSGVRLWRIGFAMVLIIIVFAGIPAVFGRSC